LLAGRSGKKDEGGKNGGVVMRTFVHRVGGEVLFRLENVS
jgi:hypothetical protein